MRTPIANSGDMFEINMGEKKKRFMLNRYSGEGGSCLAYSVTSVEGVDQGITYVLKEFYPEGDYVFAKRDENGKLKFADRTKEEPAFIRMQDRFKKGYDRLVEFANKEDSVNFMSKPAGFWFDKETGNMYSLVHWDCGKTLDEYDDLEMTVKALKKVALVLGKWHELGFYHLDVKPENVLYMEDTESIHLYDCDTVMTKEEIQDQTYPLRKSENDAYVSKELIDACTMDTRFYRQKINQKADIYSVGAMLYEKVTGIIDRRAISEACGEGFPPDLIKQDILQDMEPRLSRMLSEFFVRTMHTRQAKRFETMDQVYATLERIENVMNQQAFLVGQTIDEIAPDSKTFVDREELTEMDNGFRQGKTIVLSAMGGMGKSTLARRYAQLRKEDYDIILTHDYKVTGEEGLKRSVADICNRYLRRRNKKLRQDEKTPILIETQKEMQMSTEEQVLTLRQLCHDSKVLIIIDNFDVEEDGFAKEFGSIGWHVIYTSRCELQGFGDRIDLKPMGEQLEQLFVRYYHLESKDKIFTEDEREDIRRLLDTIGRNTLATELLAKELSICEGVISIAEMTERIKNGIENNRRKINYIRDNEAHNKSLYLALHTVFDVSEAERSGLLDEEEVEILRHLTLLAMSVTESEYIELAELDKAEFAGSLVMLKKKGWLQEQMRWKGIIQEKTYCLHPVVADVLRHEFVFNMDNCGVVVENMLSDIEKMKATFVFRNVKGKLAFVENIVKIEHQKDERINDFVCRDEFLVRLYDAWGVLSGENGEEEKAKTAFELERGILERQKKKNAVRLNELLFDSGYWGGEYGCIKNATWNKYIKKYHLVWYCMGRYYYRLGEEAGNRKAFQFYKKAFKCFTKASEEGNEDARLRVGILYQEGKGVKKDCEKAYECYQKAAQMSGVAEAQLNLGILYYEGMGVRKDYAESYLWHSKAAKQNLPEAQYNVAYLLENGIGIEKNYFLAYLWYQRAVEYGHLSAKINLANMYSAGRGVAKDHSKAYELYIEAADKDEAKAQFNIGRMYADGEGVAQDYERAYEWYLKSAELGFDGAQINLAWLYEHGNGVEKNYVKAYEWYLKAAEQGNAIAQNNLGRLYSAGHGVVRSYKKAKEWYQRSAEQGEVVGQFNLALVYYEGEGEEQDYLQAYEWFKKAAEQGHLDAQYNLGIMYYNGQGLKQSYEKAFEWYQKAAELGEAKAQNNLGYFYEQGICVAQDYSKAFEWYSKSAENGASMGQNNLGNMYRDGLGVKQDYNKAYKWYIKAAEQGDSYAQFNLGNLYYFGNGVEQDYRMTYEWMKKSAEHGYEYAQQNLGYLYYFGNGVEQNYVKAYEWYKKSAEQGLATSAYCLGELYSLGHGVEKDEEQAIYWYTKGAEGGIEDAIIKLKELGVEY